MTTPLDEAAIASHCAEHRYVGRSVRVVQVAQSTNDLSQQAAEHNAAAGLVIFAERQLRGRGQRNANWIAPAGSSLLFSILLHPPTELGDAAIVTSWAAVAVAETLRNRFRIDARIKWPNDILIERRKICGILVERSRATVVGIGLNVTQSSGQFPDNCRLTPTSVQVETGLQVDRTQLASDLLTRLEHLFAELTDRGPKTLFDRWTALASERLQQAVVAVTHHRRVSGTLVELRPDVGCRVRAADGKMVTIRSHELLRLEPSPHIRQPS